MNNHRSIQDVLIVIMRITLTQTLIMIVLTSLVSAATLNGQGIMDRKVSINVSDTDIKSILSEIEKQTSVVFTYRPSQIKASKKISLNVMDARLADVLHQLFSPTIAFLAIDKEEEIILKPKPDLPTDDYITVDEPYVITVSGKVQDEDSQPIPGVNVLEKGTTNGTTTNASGQFSIIVRDENSVLVFSFIGYQTVETRVGTQTDISITLQADVTALEEVVVVGYGTQQKVNLTGAVGTATGEALEDRPIVNVGEGLQGVIPNLNITIRNGDPADDRTDFNIRGYESINGGEPLVLVDGVPMNINKVNPADIENISVLKDASAAAVYGARAAFGVILVETKKGKGEKVNVTFGAEFAAGKPIMFIDPISDPYQYVMARGAANERTNGNFGFDQDMIDGTKQYSENPTLENAWGVYNGNLRHYGYNDYQNKLLTDWQPQQKYDMSVSGSSDKASYYMSFGYLAKDGYLKNKAKNEKYDRYNVLLKGDYKINDWLSMDSRALITTEVSDKPHFYNWDVNINTTARVDPINPISFPDLPYYLTPGDREDFAQYIGMHFSSVNFLPYLEQGGRTTWTRTETVLTQGVTLNPIKGLSIKGNFSYNLRTRNYQDAASKVNVLENADLAGGIIIGNGFSGNDWIENQNDNDQYYVVNTWADYTLDNNNGHVFKAMVGFNQEWGKNQYVRARAYSLITPLVPDLNTTTGNQETYGGKSDLALRGVFYRVNYVYRDRYLFEANGRYDGTSRFPKDDRFGFFPSFSVGWRISNEAFMSGASEWLDNLKLRASYGTLGNQQLFDQTTNPPTPIYYPYIPTMDSSPSPFMMSAGARIPTVSAAGLVSPTLTWETVITKNFGIDFTTFGDKLDVSFDIYTRDTKDMLTSVEYPAILGTTAPDANAADLRTKGWELAATWRDRIKNDWNYSVTLALADNTSEITKYDNPTGVLPDPSNVNTEFYVGQIIGERWGFVTEGIFQTDDEVANHADQSQLGANWRPGDIKYADLNGDGKITRGKNTLDDPGDQKIIAYEAPRYTFGINGSISWKGFSLSMFFQGVLKYDYWPPNDNWNAFYPYNAGNVEWYYLTETWSPENRDAYFPAPHISTNTKQNVQPQSRYVQDGKYIRLKNLTLAYNLPTSLITKAGLVNARVYFAGQNIFEFTNMHKPLDPEVRPTVTQEYYKTRTYSLGLNITF